MLRHSLITMVCVVAVLSATPAFALDNDLVLSRFATFDPQEFGNCQNACGIVKPNRLLFENLVHDVGLLMSPRIAAPAETLGEAGFAFNVITSLNFIPAEEEHWQLGVEDQDPSDTMLTTFLQVRKGLPFSFELAGNFGYLYNSELFALGADLKWALNEGFYYFPDLAVRGSVNTLMGSPDLNLVTAAGDMSMSKAFGISGVMTLTPYIGYQMVFIFGSSRLLNAYPQDPRTPQFDTDRPSGPGSTTFSPEFVFEQHDTQANRFFVGARLNVWILNFVVEGVFADVSQANLAVGVDF